MHKDIEDTLGKAMLTDVEDVGVGGDEAALLRKPISTRQEIITNLTSSICGNTSRNKPKCSFVLPIMNSLRLA